MEAAVRVRRDISVDLDRCLRRRGAMAREEEHHHGAECDVWRDLDLLPAALAYALLGSTRGWRHAVALGPG